MIRQLRALQITPEDLKSRLDAGDGFVLRVFLEAQQIDDGVIPGAIRLDPLELRRKKQIHIPHNVSVIIYCRSRNSFVSARVAAAMRKHGVQRVQVLAGGLKAWKVLGLPLGTKFSDPQTELNRLGIEVQPPWQPFPAKKY